MKLKLLTAGVLLIAGWTTSTLAVEYWTPINDQDCGPLSAMIFAARYGKNPTLSEMRRLCRVNETGTSFLNIKKALSAIELPTVARNMTPEELLAVSEPAIIFLERPDTTIGHFVTIWPNPHGDALLIDSLRDPTPIDPLTFRYWNGISLILDDAFDSHDAVSRGIAATVLIVLTMFLIGRYASVRLFQKAA